MKAKKWIQELLNIYKNARHQLSEEYLVDIEMHRHLDDKLQYILRNDPEIVRLLDGKMRGLIKEWIERYGDDCIVNAIAEMKYPFDANRLTGLITAALNEKIKEFTRDSFHSQLGEIFNEIASDEEKLKKILAKTIKENLKKEFENNLSRFFYDEDDE